ncbi:hypothetical protein Hanom_Chr02g00112871 [Helianthus anomalus]
MAGGSPSSSSSSSFFMYKPSCSNGFRFRLMSKQSTLFSSNKGSVGATLNISRSSRNRELSFISTIFSI